MGKFLATFYLKWEEPVIVRDARTRIERNKLTPLRQIMYVLIAFGSVMLSWYFARMNPAKNPPPMLVAILSAMSFSLLLVYGLPWFYRRCKHRVRISDHGITLICANRFRFWKYDNIASCSLISKRYGDESISVLTLTTSRGETTPLGVDESVSLDELCEVLSNHGVTVDR